MASVAEERSRAASAGAPRTTAPPSARRRAPGAAEAFASEVSKQERDFEATARFAPADADRKERDYAALQAAVEDGRLEVEREAD